MKSKKQLPSTPYIDRVILKRATVPSFKVYPFSLPVVRNLKEIKLHPHVTFIVGENGSGKSTLLEAIAVAYGFNAEGGSKNFNFATRESHSELSEFLALVKMPSRPTDGFFIRAESYFNMATEIERLDEGTHGPIIQTYGGISLHEQSHGESFLSTFQHRFKGHGFYIMDEPEAALSPMRQMSLIVRLHQLVKDGSQFVIATHSPILMSYPDATIFEMSNDGLKKVAYRDTEHFKITQTFFADPEQMAKLLMDNA
jgi:predicted ATPase